MTLVLCRDCRLGYVEGAEGCPGCAAAPTSAGADLSTSGRVRKVREKLVAIGPALREPTADRLIDAAQEAHAGYRYAPSGSALRVGFGKLEARLRLLQGNVALLEGRTIASSPTCVAQLQRARAALEETVAAARVWEES